jgi:UDP-glucose 4-epimerase
MELLINQCPRADNDVSGETILIFGGSGSLGKEVIKRWISKNRIINVSRDEEKQWSLRMNTQSPNLQQRIGDISIEDDVMNAILIHKPTMICIFACLKHIDLCELYPAKSIMNNTNGIMNVHTVLQKYSSLHNVSRVLFVSTDKACMPITTYGCSKAISEFFLQGVLPGKTKWTGIRYGNVLNSSGSIIPYLQTNAKYEKPYTLTHPDMNRFIMTLPQSVNLIEYALMHGLHNEIIIPYIYSMKISDLFSIFEKKYNKSRAITGLRCKEKIHEDLISVSEAKNTYIRGGYFHVTPNPVTNEETGYAFDSSKHLISVELLEEYLLSQKYIP